MSPCLLVLAVLLAPRASLTAEPPDKPLEYQRYFVPADRPQEWPNHNVRYLPINREEFEELVRAANGQAKLAAGEAPIARAKYTAKLAEPDVLVGEAELDIRHDGLRPTVVALEPFGMSLQTSRWADNAEATVGAQPDGRLAVVVERPGKLHCTWSLRGRRDSTGSLLLPLAFPAATVCELELELPDTLTPAIAQGVETSDAENRRAGKWRFELGGRSRALLRLDPAEGRAKSRRLVLLQEKTTYQLLPGNIDVAAQLRLDVYREPVRRLELDLDSPLRVVRVQYGGGDLPWSVSKELRPGGLRATIDFPEPLIGPARVVTVNAVAPFDIDVPVRLPRLRVRDVAWQEGEMTLMVFGPLALDALMPQGCRQTKVSPLSGGPFGESLELQLFSAEAAVTVQASQRRSRAKLFSGTTLRFAPDSLRAEFRGRVEAAEGEVFVLHGSLAPGWEIDSVTADRAEALASWNVDRSRRPASVVVQFAESVTPARPVQLMITGHRRAAAGARYASQTLDFLRFHDVVDEVRLLALETSSSQHFNLNGVDRPLRRQRGLFSVAERALLPSALSDVIFEIDADRPAWNVAIEQQAPRYSVDIHGKIDVEQSEVHELYRIRCQPAGSPVEQLLLWFSQSHPEALSLSGDDAIGSLVAERLGADEKPARGLPRSGETWLVRLARPMTEPFEIQARRAVPVTSPVMPALVAAPEAESQQGLLQIQFAGPPLAIESADRLEPVPPPPSSGERNAVAAAAFRYDPIAEMGDTPSAAIVLHESAGGKAPANAVVWRLRLYSHYRPSGESHHAAVFEIENHGATECMLNLPLQAELLKVTVDGVVLAGRPVGPELKLALPERTFPVAVVEFLVREGPMSVIENCAAPWPAIPLPIAERAWVVSSAAPYEPLSWSQEAGPWPLRLFGSFGRRPGDHAFHPASISDWRNLVTVSRAEDPSLERATKLLEALGQIIAADSARVSTLGRLFASGRTKEPALFAGVYIDQRSLAAVGIDVGSTIDVHPVHGDLPPTLAAALACECFGASDLALLVDGEQLVVTARATAAELRAQITDEGCAFVFKRPPRDLVSARPSTARPSYLPLSSWLQSPPTEWDAEARPGTSAPFASIACLYGIEPDSSGVWRAHLVHRDAVIATGWAIGCVVLSVGAALRRGRLVWLAANVFLALLLALWAPPVLLPLARGLFLGALTWAAGTLVRPKGRAPRSAAAPGPSPVSARAAGSLVLLLSVFPGTANGDERTVTTEARERPPVYRVFIPTDAANKPSTRPYQVPTDFLDELRRRANLANREPRGWLITAANYECTLTREKLDGPIAVGQLVARYQLHVLSSNVRVRLPFQRRQVEVVADSAYLDGEPIELAWSEAGDELVCDIYEPGAYELEFQLLPVLGDATDLHELNLSIPKVAAATFDVWLPGEDIAVELPDLTGARSVLEGGRKLSARLGPVDALVLRWPRQAAVAPVFEVEELLWLNVRPGSVVLEVTLKLNVTSGMLRQLEFAADRRLRLVPGALTAKERTTPSQPEVSNSPQTIQFDLEQPLNGQASLRLSFFVSGSSGVGNIRLPSFHTLHARTDSRWLAVTVDPGLEYETLDAEQLEALAAADFAKEWGADGDALQDARAYRLNSAETSWSLATRSREPQTTANESLSLSFQRAQAQVRYDAQLMTPAGFVFQHRLLVPADVAIERITLEEDGVDRVSHWARSSSGVVSVFLNRRLTGAQQLSLIGRMPVRANGRAPVPLITMETGLAPVTIERTDVRSRTVHFYRQPTVRIVLEASAGLSPLPDAAPDAFRGRLGRLVLSRAAERDYSGTVVVLPNDYRLRDVQQVTSLRYANQQWIAEADWRFVVEDGVMDTLRLGLPTAWTANIEVVSPASNVRLDEQAGQDGTELTVQPLAPFSGDCEIKLRAALKFAPGDAVIAPDIVGFDLPAGQRYWLLPRQVGVESVRWDIQRMSLDASPEALGAAPSDAWFAFRAVGDRPQAVMSAVKASVDASRVRLADVRLARRGNGLTAAVAFDLEPGGRASCPLELSDGWQLLQVTVGGTLVMPLAKGPGKWEVLLASNRLPQRLEATLSSETGARLEQVSLPIAWCADWPVEETLLTIHAPGDERLDLDANPTNLETCDAARTASVIELTDLPPETIATTPSDDLAAWYAPWARWFAFVDRQTLPVKTGTSDTDAAGAETLRREKWAQIASKLNLEQFLSKSDREPPRATQPLEIWQQVHAASPASYYHWAGPRTPARVRFVREWRGWLRRLLESTAIGAVLLAALFLPRSLGLSDFLLRWPHALGAGLGLLWWLFCQPSAVGWLLIGWSVVMGLRSLVRPMAS